MKVLKKYVGGIHNLIQAAVREDGKLFVRFQDKTPRGYVWGKWKEKGVVDTENIPETLKLGFSILYEPSRYTDFGCRLPK